MVGRVQLARYPSSQKIRPTSGLLVTYAPITSPSAFMPDNGLAGLAAVLKKNGHQAQVLDYCTTDTLRQLVSPKQSRALADIWENIQTRMKSGKKPRLLDVARLLFINHQMVAGEKKEVSRVSAEILKIAEERDVDWVGFKLWNGTGFTIPLSIASELKRRRPELQVLGGGSHVDIFMENILLAGPGFDALVFGEGEEALLRHADRIGGSGEPLEEIPNTIFRGEAGPIRTNLQRIRDLDGLPFPDYSTEIYPAMQGKKMHIFVLSESQGCDNFCAFCTHSTKSGGQIVERSAGRIIEEMRSLFEQFGANYFRFGGSSTPGRLISVIANELIARNMDVHFSAFARVNDVTGADFETWKRSGHFGQFFGIESGSQQILNSMEKKVLVADAERVVKASVASGLFTVTSFVFPSPGETARSRQETLDFVRRTHPSSVIVNPPIVMPRTKWERQAGDFGIKLSSGFVDATMRYPIRHMLPLRFWPKAPWEIDGRNSRELFAQATDLRKEIEAMGIATGVSDDLGLMAHGLGMRPSEFMSLAQRLLFTGNADEIDGLIRQFNLAKSAC